MLGRVSTTGIVSREVTSRGVTSRGVTTRGAKSRGVISREMTSRGVTTREVSAGRVFSGAGFLLSLMTLLVTVCAGAMVYPLAPAAQEVAAVAYAERNPEAHAPQAASAIVIYPGTVPDARATGSASTTVSYAGKVPVPRETGSASGAVSAPSITTPGQDPTRKLTLEQSIEIALQNNKQILIQKQEVERMKGQVIQARSTAFPNLSGDTRYVRSQGTMNFGGRNGITFDIKDSYYGGSLSLVQPLYTAGRVGGALRAAKAAKSYAQENFRAATKDVIFAVKASFGGVLLAQKMAVLAKESLDLADAHLKNVDQLFKQGVASEYELIRAKVQVAQLVPERIKAENELDRAMIVFRNTLGLAADEKVEPEGDLERRDVEMTAEEAFKLAKENSHELAAARLRVSGMSAALDVAKSDRYPSLSLVASAQMETNEPRWKSEDWRSRIWSASVALSIPIFDGLRTKGKIQQTRAEYEQAGLYADLTEDAVRLDVEQAVSRLDQARKLVESLVASVEQAQKGLDIANLRYRNGVGTQLEVLDAQVALSSARTNYFMSTYGHFMAVAEIERATSVSFE